MPENSQPYSYHTFFFPFLWNDGGSDIKRKTFAKCLRKDNWHRDEEANVKHSDAELHEQYNQFHYFNAAARNAIYTNAKKEEELTNAVVWNYRYDLSLLAKNGNKDWLYKTKTNANPAKYVIEKGEKRIALHINGIRLKLFNTGIGILIFELENYAYPHPDDIAWINDYGRRIYMPFSSDYGCSACADNIALQYGDVVLASGTMTEKPASFDSTSLAAPILYLLQNGPYSVTTDRDKKNKYTFFIEPIIDDRMFVACYYVNKPVTDSMSQWENGQYGYLQDAENKCPDDPDNRASLLYRLMFVDSTSTTCQSRPMLKQLLEKHIYDRWIEYEDGGSITGITEYSMISITASDADFLARNFLTEYIEMMILVLAQRASLLAFESMISDNAQGKKPDIMTIQKSYILFQSQLLLKEVTPQQQGIELYRMLLDNMFIAEQTAEIENQIDALFTQKTSRSEARENLILLILAILGVVEVVDCVSAWTWPSVSSIVKSAIPIALIVVAIIWYIKNRRK